MAGEHTTRVCALAVPGGPEPWARAGFRCGAQGFSAGEVSVVLDGPGSDGARLILDPPSALDGAGTLRSSPTRLSHADHPNKVVGIDHVVVTTPSMARTRAAMLDAGLDLRRETTAHRGDRELQQAFFLAGSCVVELVGETGERDDPAALWGITFVTPDLDGLPALEGEPVASIREAVQPGRRIAVARRKTGLPVRVAFMDPRTPGQP